MEFWGDEIDTLSYFDSETQRRTENAERLVIGPSAEALVAEPEILAGKIEDMAASLRGKMPGKARSGSPREKRINCATALSGKRG